jgi:hypothetical protein
MATFKKQVRDALIKDTAGRLRVTTCRIRRSRSGLEHVEIFYVGEFEEGDQELIKTMLNSVEGPIETPSINIHTINVIGGCVTYFRK